MNDAFAVAWKEWREVLGKRGFRGKLGIGLALGAFGVVLPLQTGDAWITSPSIVLAWTWVPMFYVATVIADAFAGERERHTLETLLATRLSDTAILAGKMLAALAYAGSLTVSSLLLGLVVINVTRPGPGLLVYSAPMAAAMLGLGVLGSLFVAGTGVLISLRATTVRQAQQTLGGVVMAIGFGPLMLLRWMPAAWKQPLLAGSFGTAGLGLSVVASLVLIDVAVLAWTRRRFNRARLIDA